jgi:hypothetical protein
MLAVVSCMGLRAQIPPLLLPSVFSRPSRQRFQWFHVSLESRCHLDVAYFGRKRPSWRVLGRRLHVCKCSISASFLLNCCTEVTFPLLSVSPPLLRLCHNLRRCDIPGGSPHLLLPKSRCSSSSSSWLEATWGLQENPLLLLCQRRVNRVTAFPLLLALISGA